ncbi:hypothetical protein A2303_05515 [Candidatus Falkowbacteria bacterium RIFOXYB2_FULL_47_14]|uniref:Uncharacterized protein n=1 Tax=Candidatus Falkowbacteria bacterium RIFOXYA2_FULL_47_19 TaxID=1797994 RepID=A0A1F5SEQ2_9BACT|nr:MAG: hypothetical protein A2227_06920 [Candidatus Falkowbacteria bacterium RIFOXYA2_FULL_47_19]OGF35308.1 MAG: hypothetical protein A2468_00070 [Candidatus Falkowbacteria bacterium RIFOXYC2_FULL_46_15]OGF43745.1 MAG: hypothetical protein A2303_05515 [Candidatus Falkowbacteria bacterium RIFOXYB2_FULL_47_14]
MVILPVDTGPISASLAQQRDFYISANLHFYYDNYRLGGKSIFPLNYTTKSPQNQEKGLKIAQI